MCFILTMRNVNGKMKEIGKNIVHGFILTMRNVNVLNIVKSKGVSNVLY